MDKNSKVRMPTGQEAANDVYMEDDTHEALVERAVGLAYETFPDTTDAPITGVYAWLVWCSRRGVQADSVTVH